MALMDRKSDVKHKGHGVRVSGPAGIVSGGSECPVLSTVNTTTEVRPLSKAPNSQLLPGRRSINGCPLTGCVFTVCVCVWCLFTTHCCVCALGWVKCRAQIQSMGRHTWQLLCWLWSQETFTNMIKRWIWDKLRMSHFIIGWFKS